MSRHIAGRGRGGAPRPAAAPPVPDVPCRLDRKLTLGQFLKLAGLVDSGAEAKEAVAAGLVRVDDQVDTRRGRQLGAGDVVDVEGRRARVVDEGQVAS